MKRKRYSYELIGSVLRQAEAGRRSRRFDSKWGLPPVTGSSARRLRPIGT